MAETVLQIEMEYPGSDEILSNSQLLPAPMDKDAVQDQVAQWLVGEKGVTLNRLQMFVGEEARFLSKIDDFYHLSRFGEGHSESRASRLGVIHLVPEYTAYEVEWWSRHIKFDKGSSTNPFISDSDRVLMSVRRNTERTGIYSRVIDNFRKEALRVAEQYAMKTSIGSPQVLRRFLEETIVTTTSLNTAYLEAFKKLFTPKGWIEFEKRLKLADIADFRIRDISKGDERRVRLAKIICGLTRTRKFISPEWADVPRFWTKDKESKDN